MTDYNYLEFIGFVIYEDEFVYKKNILDITTDTNLKEDEKNG